MGTVLAKPAPITPARLKQYNHDIISFLEEQYICAETGKLIKLEAWQKDDILRPVFYDLNPDGTRKYSLALIGMPKKNGKSTLVAGIGVWFCFASEPHGEIIVAANNLDQASLIIYDKIRTAIRDNPNLAASAKLLKGKIAMNSTGTVCRPIAAKYETAAGVNPTLVLFDELWGFPDRKFYDELTTSPARKNPLSIIVTYAGYDKKSLLYELYDQGMKREDPNMFFLWMTENKASWVTPKYLATQRKRLPAGSYARFHQNQWAAKDSTFVTTDDIQLLHATPWVKQEGATLRNQPDYLIACDLGLSHDRACRVVGHYNFIDTKIYIDNIMWWEGTKKEHVDIGDVEKDLYDCADRFKTRNFVIDPWQMEYVIQRMRKSAWEGINVTPFNFNADIGPMSNLLIQLLREGRLVGYEEPLLDTELQEAVSKQTTKGWRIEHERGKTNDLVITVAMLCLAAVSGNFSEAYVPDSDTEFKTPTKFGGILKKEF